MGESTLGLGSWTWAVFLAWLIQAVHWFKTLRESFLYSLLRAAAVVSLPVGVVYYCSESLVPEFMSAWEDRLQIPLPWALANSVALLCFLLALWWRLGRPQAAGERSVQELGALPREG